MLKIHFGGLQIYENEKEKEKKQRLHILYQAVAVCLVLCPYESFLALSFDNDSGNSSRVNNSMIIVKNVVVRNMTITFL